MPTTINSRSIANVTSLVQNGGTSYPFTWSSVITANTTASSNYGYPVNTGVGRIAINLPATANVGDTIAIFDYAGYASSNNITINPNGGRIQGLTANSVITTSRGSFELTYIDSNRGWLVQSSSVTGLGFLVNYLVVAGGGAGSGIQSTGQSGASGGGAGGFIESFTYATSGSSFLVTVGAGATGAGYTTQPANGSNSVFGSQIARGGGGAGYYVSPYRGQPGGSGGGGIAYGSGGVGGSGTPGQGNDGGSSVSPPFVGSGGGGGAGSAGFGGAAFGTGGGGNGLQSSITGLFYAAGGSPGGNTTSVNSIGGAGNASGSGSGGNAVANRGSGGGGGTASGGGSSSGGSGGSGVIVIRIPSFVTATFSGGVTQTSSTSSGFTTYTITAAGVSDTVTFS